MKVIITILAVWLLASVLVFAIFEFRAKPKPKDCGITIGRELLDENCVYRGNISIGLPGRQDESLRVDWAPQSSGINL